MPFERNNIEVNATMMAVTEKTKSGFSNTDAFIEEFYRNFTVTHTLKEKHSSSIQFLYNFTAAMNKTLLNVKNKQKKMSVSISQWFDTAQGCQAGYDVGGDAYPAHTFPSGSPKHSITTKFNPPFKTVPAFSFVTTTLDSTSHLSFRLKLLSLTPDSFTLQFQTWGKYALFSAKFSWMACPK